MADVPFNWSPAGDVTQYPPTIPGGNPISGDLPTVLRPKTLAEQAMATVAWGLRDPATFVVDKSGGGDSTTIQGIAGSVGPGDIVEIRAGTYRETLRPGANGTLAGGPIVYRSAPGASVKIITGSPGVGIDFSNRKYCYVVGRRGPWNDEGSPNVGIEVSAEAPRGTLAGAAGNTKKHLDFTSAEHSGVIGCVLHESDAANTMLIFNHAKYCSLSYNYIEPPAQRYQDSIQINGDFFRCWIGYNRLLGYCRHTFIEMLQSPGHFNDPNNYGGCVIEGNQGTNHHHRMGTLKDSPCSLWRWNVFPRSGYGFQSHSAYPPDLFDPPVAGGYDGNPLNDCWHLWGSRSQAYGNVIMNAGDASNVGNAAHQGQVNVNNNSGTEWVPQYCYFFHNTFQDNFGIMIRMGVSWASRNVHNWTPSHPDKTHKGMKYVNNIYWRTQWVGNDSKAATIIYDQAGDQYNDGGHEIRNNALTPVQGRYLATSAPAAQYTNATATFTFNGLSFSDNVQCVDPQFLSDDPEDYDNGFVLSPASPYINAGGNLTTATNSGTDASVVNVADVFYFSGGYGVAEPEVLRLNGERIYVTDVVWNRANDDDTTGSIRFTPTRTWTAGAALNLDYGGLAPDLGAKQTGLDDPDIPEIIPESGDYRIDCGGPGYVGAETWTQDIYYTSGTSSVRSDAIAGTTEDDLYNARRVSGNWSIPYVSTNVLEITLHGYEHFYEADGGRTFDFSINGTPQGRIDWHAIAGGKNIAASFTTYYILPEGVEALNITLSPVADNPTCSAIQIIEVIPGEMTGIDTAPMPTDVGQLLPAPPALSMIGVDTAPMPTDSGALESASVLGGIDTAPLPSDVGALWSGPAEIPDPEDPVDPVEPVDPEDPVPPVQPSIPAVWGKLNHPLTPWRKH